MKNVKPADLFKQNKEIMADNVNLFHFSEVRSAAACLRGGARKPRSGGGREGSGAARRSKRVRSCVSEH